MHCAAGEHGKAAGESESFAALDDGLDVQCGVRRHDKGQRCLLSGLNDDAILISALYL